MGGGKSRSDSSQRTTNNDNRIGAAEGGYAVGQGGSLSINTTSPEAFQFGGEALDVAELATRYAIGSADRTVDAAEDMAGRFGELSHWTADRAFDTAEDLAGETSRTVSGLAGRVIDVGDDAFDRAADLGRDLSSAALDLVAQFTASSSAAASETTRAALALAEKTRETPQQSNTALLSTVAIAALGAFAFSRVVK